MAAAYESQCLALDLGKKADKICQRELCFLISKVILIQDLQFYPIL